ncbi:Appr-1-p processing protein [Leptolyngbya sp. 'hensonii']|uniref:macro domain-containing protein n=1 Tax=Leptolyngbya sp. 'hensonii' TaxID=1922337 RepID=UPI00094F9336|nr:macro domain-containing protein [Leptolyngbya sp. 'hensonii']OLP18251.1 Appr-1-p processing protein [Leptolyngbya sp. 'hensonii']
MNAPTIQFIPLREVVSTTTSATLDVLVKIVPPDLDRTLKRPPLNLGLVIDRSGSMQAANKINFARAAACYAVEQLLPHDRVSVTIYDDRVETLVPNSLVLHKALIMKQIRQIKPRNMTALHAGWVEGGVQVSQHLKPEQMNRIILLSDGLANVGETNPDVIASDVRGLAQRGVSTTTMGVGNDYNEDLLEGMAVSGDGNYYYIESAEQLPDIFEIELQGLVATVGRAVTLSVEPLGRVELLDVLNDLDVDRHGYLKLPNLLLGNPFNLVLRLKVPPQSASSSIDLCGFSLSWDDPALPERQMLRAMLQLPAVSAAELDEFPFNLEVRRYTALLMSARAKREAVQRLDEGNYGAVSDLFVATRSQLSEVPSSPEIEQELQSLDALEADLQAQDYGRLRKSSHYEAMSRGSVSSEEQLQHYYAQKLGAIDKKQKDLNHRILVVQGDIIYQQVDAIVNTTDANLTGTGNEVAAAIHRAAGPALEEACRLLKGCKIGEAKLTKGYNLPVHHILHTVAPLWQGGGQGEEKLLAQCYRSCLELAAQNNCQSIAFPAIGCGALGFPAEIATQVAFAVVTDFLKTHSLPDRVVFVCFDSGIYASYLARS